MGYLLIKFDLFVNVWLQSYNFNVSLHFLNGIFLFVYNHLFAYSYMMSIIPI